MKKLIPAQGAAFWYLVTSLMGRRKLIADLLNFLRMPAVFVMSDGRLLKVLTHE